MLLTNAAGHMLLTHAADTCMLLTLIYRSISDYQYCLGHEMDQKSNFTRLNYPENIWLKNTSFWLVLVLRTPEGTGALRCTTWKSYLGV